MKQLKQWYQRHITFWHAFNAISTASLLAFVTTASMIYLGTLVVS